MPPVLDLEWNPFSPTCTLRPPAAEVRRVANRFISIVERHYQTRVVVYTAPDFWVRNDVARLKRDFWLRSTAKHVEKRYAVRGWRFWQYTATGVLDGIEKEVDLNCFNGNGRHSGTNGAKPALFVNPYSSHSDSCGIRLVTHQRIQARALKQPRDPNANPTIGSTFCTPVAGSGQFANRIAAATWIKTAVIPST